MELVQELLMTVFVALVLSLLVAKLVSIAIAGDVASDSKNFDFETVVEKVKFGREFIVQSTETERRLQFVEQVTEIVDEIQAQRSLPADQIEVSRVVVELPEKSSVEMAAELMGGFEFEGLGEGTALTGLEGLIVEERNKSTKADQIDGDREEANIETTGLDGTIDEEKIVEIAKADDEIDVELGGNDDVIDKGECRANQGSGIEGKLSGSDEEDGWEGIERSELEKVFAMAARYVGYGGNTDGLANVGSDVQMQLYGLHKVAMEGACHETQPMALKVAARAKWNAWKRLGNMSPEVAMEQYITLLSDKVPGWMECDSADDGKRDS